MWTREMHCWQATTSGAPNDSSLGQLMLASSCHTGHSKSPKTPSRTVIRIVVVQLSKVWGTTRKPYLSSDPKPGGKWKSSTTWTTLWRWRTFRSWRRRRGTSCGSLSGRPCSRRAHKRDLISWVWSCGADWSTPWETRKRMGLCLAMVSSHLRGKRTRVRLRSLRIRIGRGSDCSSLTGVSSKEWSSYSSALTSCQLQLWIFRRRRHRLEWAIHFHLLQGTNYLPSCLYLNLEEILWPRWLGLNLMSSILKERTSKLEWESGLRSMTFSSCRVK